MIRRLFVFLVCLIAVNGLSFAQTEPEEPPRMIPVIVDLDVYSRPETALSGISAINAQRSVIASTQTRVLLDLALDGVTVENLTAYETLPALSLNIAEDEIENLRRNPAVAGVYRDEFRPAIGNMETTSAGNVIGVSTAWDYGYTGAGYSVAILDTGVDFNHPALSSKRLEELCFSTSGYDYGPNGTSSPVVSACPNGQVSQIGGNAARPYPGTCDGCDHGTHVAGIAAGTPTSYSGYNGGVAKGAKIIGVQIFSIFTNSAFCAAYGYGAPCTFTYDSDQLDALNYLYQHRTNWSGAGYPLAAANMSLGGGQYRTHCDSAYSTSYRDAVTNLVNNNSAVIAAAGNNGYLQDIGAPACISNIISVGATADNDTVASFSNVAEIMDYFAPGVNITSSVPGGGYGIMDGTSMATPMVTGAWAVMRQAYPAYNWSQIRSRLSDTGRMINDIYVSKPRIHISAAVPQLNANTLFTSGSTLTDEGTVIPVYFTIQVTLGTLPSPQRVYLSYGGTATRNADYTAPDYVDLTHSGGWPKGTYIMTGYLPVSLLTDRIIDDNEQVMITMTGVGAGIIGAPASHTIFVDDINVQAAGTLRVPPESTAIDAIEGQILQIPFDVVVVDGPPDLPAFTATLNLGGTAVEGVDYTVSHEVVFDQAEYAAGTYTETVSLQAINRGDEVQGARTVTLTLASENSDHVVIGTPSQVTVTIDDAAFGTITETELYTWVNDAIAADSSLRLNYVLFDITPTKIITTVRLDDGTLGTVNITPVLSEGLLVFNFDIPSSPSTAFTQAVHQELPPLLAYATQSEFEHEGINRSQVLYGLTMTGGVLEGVFFP